MTFSQLWLCVCDGLTLIFPLHHHGRQVTQETSSVPEKGLQDHSSPKARWWGCTSSFHPELQSIRVSVLQDTITLAIIRWSTKAMASLRLLNWFKVTCTIKVLWLQVGIPPAGFALLSREAIVVLPSLERNRKTAFPHVFLLRPATC